MSPSIGDESLEQQPESWNPRESALKNLEKQLDIELKDRVTAVGYYFYTGTGLDSVI